MSEHKNSPENLQKILESTPIGNLAAQVIAQGATPSQNKKASTSPPTSNDNEANIPNLDQIINQITSNGDFKEMMNNVSEGLQLPLKEVSIPESSDESDTNSKNNESLYDLCCTFLSDNDGNSLADILSQINQNLTTISKTLEEIKDLKTVSTANE